MKKFFLTMVILAASVSMSAETDNIHTVQRGETIELIAQKYGISVEELKKANPDINELFFTGMKLTIPAKQTPAATPTPVPANTTPNSSETPVVIPNQPVKAEEDWDYKSAAYFDAGYSYYNLCSEGASKGSKFHGFCIGCDYEVSLSKVTPVFLDFGIYINWHWNSDAVMGMSAKSNFGFFKIPFNLLFRIKAGGCYISPYAGINFKIGVGGTTKISDLNAKSDWFSSDGYDYSRFMMGWQAGVKIGDKTGFIGAYVGTDFVKFDKHMDQLNVGANLGLYF